jgi:localization factor PodJL
LIGRHPRPVLLGGAVLLALATAAIELRGGHSPMRKSEIDLPANPLALNAPESGNVDTTPTGALSATPNVIAAPLPAPGASPDAAVKSAPKQAAPAAKPAPDLVAGLPAGLPVELKSAASNGDLGAAIEIAQRYLEGRTVPREPKTAAGWFQAAADAGSPFAQYRLRALYEKGIGVARDPAKARELYAKAADAGNVRAMHNLAVLYAQDGGAGKPDYVAAMDAFRRAASYGVRDSQFNLGVLYGRGLGAAQDLASAWLYFSLAAKQGDTDASHKRDEVATRMDGRIMAKATKLLADFKAETPAPAANDPPAAPAQAAGAPAADPAGKIGDVKL